MEESSDAAERIYEFFNGFVAVYGDLPSDEDNVQAVICAMFDIPKNDTRSCTAALAELLTLPEQLEIEIRSIEGLDYKKYESVVKSMDTLFARMGLRVAGQTVKEAVSRSKHDQLPLVSGILAKDGKTRKHNANHLVKIYDHLVSLEKEVKSSELPADLKVFVLALLADVRFAMDHYEIFGPEYVVAKVDRLIGGTLRNQQTAKQADRSILQKVKEAGVGVLWALQVINTGYELSEHIIPLLSEDSLVQDVDQSPPANKT